MATLRQQIATGVLTVTRFRDLMKTLKANRPNDDLAIVKKAYDYSQKHHSGQSRASGEPYLVHPLEVACVLAEMKMDPVAAASRLGRRYLGHRLRHPPGVWRAGRSHRGRCDQDQRDRFFHPGRATSREF